MGTLSLPESEADAWDDSNAADRLSSPPPGKPICAAPQVLSIVPQCHVRQRQPTTLCCDAQTRTAVLTVPAPASSPPTASSARLSLAELLRRGLPQRRPALCGSSSRLRTRCGH
jgi:hypothetical protein